MFFLNYVKSFLANFRNVRLLYYKYNKKFSSFRVFNFLKDTSIFVDLGANVGLVSSYVNDVSNSCSIYCYEPHPAAFKVLKEKFMNLENVRIYNSAVSDKSSKGKLFLHSKSDLGINNAYSQSSSLYSEKENVESSKFVEISTVSIKSVLDQFDYIDCVKVDIEGSEYKIIPFLIENRSKIGKVVCELHGGEDSNGSILHPHFSEQYDSTIETLASKKLLGSWFILWH